MVLPDEETPVAPEKPLERFDNATAKALRAECARLQRTVNALQADVNELLTLKQSNSRRKASIERIDQEIKELRQVIRDEAMALSKQFNDKLAVLRTEAIGAQERATAALEKIAAARAPRPKGT